MAFKAALKLGISQSVHEGVYSFIPGPSFESRAEARFLLSIGADCVGMSTVPEVVCAAHCGLKILGLSLITNSVSRFKGQGAKAFVEGSECKKFDTELIASHEEVLETSAKMAKVFVNWVVEIIHLIEKQ